MDIRKLFQTISEQLLLEFQKASQVNHPGGKGDHREDAFRKFLIEHLPKRYAVGTGEVISPYNFTSGQLDIVIHDPLHCPVLMSSASHAVYPVESVFGAISMKSHLNSGELEDGYGNIESLKRILIKNGFQNEVGGGGLVMGMSFPMPVTGIVAYGANRSLDAIAKQAEALDNNLSDISLRPDFIAVIGQGIIGPRNPLRGTFNQIKIPQEAEQLIELRKTGRHTLLRLYMQILRELNALVLRPLDLKNYNEMPKLVGKHRVGRRNSTFVRYRLEGDIKDGKVSRFSQSAIELIVAKAKPVTMRQAYLNMLGVIPEGLETTSDLNQIVYEYNPNALPPLNPSNVKKDDKGRVRSMTPAFCPVQLEIDGKYYHIDGNALNEEHFEEETDFTMDELFSN